MKIEYVTMTGADDNTSIEEMSRLSEKYPFAEWGILFSGDGSRRPRYPQSEWVDNLFGHQMRLSAHLCGSWVGDPLKTGRLTFLNDWEMEDLFGRVQLNMNVGRLVAALHPEAGALLWEAIGVTKPVILGGDYVGIDLWNTPVTIDPRRFWSDEVYVMYDTSGGRGHLTQKWLPPIVVNETSLFTGYAGGLSPENLEEQLGLIEQACNVEVQEEPKIWIDAETHLRNDKDEFDLERCEQFLKVAEAWVG